MANQTGIALSIVAFLPTGKSLDEQFAALTIVKAAHESGDYGPLLAAAKVENVKTEQKTRRIPDAQLPGTEPNMPPAGDDKKDEPGDDGRSPEQQSAGLIADTDPDIPAFIKNDSKKSKAA
jgi:hypothetical protein